MDARELERSAARIEHKLDLILARLEQQPDRMDQHWRDSDARFERDMRDKWRMTYFMLIVTAAVFIATW